MDKLQERIDTLTNDLTGNGLKITTEKPISYGVQLVVADGTDSIPVNIYSGKKGISIVVGGSANSILKQKIQCLIDGVPITPVEIVDGERPPGFEGVKDFDNRWIGSDESGKGDFFGSLVVAAVMVDERIAAELADKAVRDCKVVADNKIRQQAKIIRDICEGRFVELELTPARYNALYQQMQQEGKNLNHLLAWAHARVLEDTLTKAPCRFAIADQFANERYILSRLMDKGREIVLVQTHRAERNIAVAAASVLARDRFLARMDELSARFGITLPKGASTQVVDAAKAFVGKHGRAALSEVCKLHFKTIEKV